MTNTIGHPSRLGRRCMATACMDSALCVVIPSCTMSSSFASSSHLRTSKPPFQPVFPQRRHFVSRSVLCFNRHDTSTCSCKPCSMLCADIDLLQSQSCRALAGDSCATYSRQTAECATWLSCQFCTAYSTAAGASKQCSRRYA